MYIFCTEKPFLQLVCLKNHVYKIPGWYNVLFWERTNHWICKSLRNSCEVFVRHSNVCFCTEKPFLQVVCLETKSCLKDTRLIQCALLRKLITGFAKVCKTLNTFDIIYKASIAVLHMTFAQAIRLCAHCMLQSILSISEDVGKNAYPWFTLDS